MRFPLPRIFALALLFPLAHAGPWAEDARAQDERRSYFEPGLMVETGARMGACDALTFTPDGQFLLAAGDDKVVRVWKCTGKGLVRPEKSADILRWSIYREQRGAIYALALSPDRDSRYVAVGGYGLREGALAVLNRETGAVAHALKGERGQGDGQVTWSLAFSPSGRQLLFGKEDGSVWLWNLDSRQTDVRQLGRHPGRQASNRVRLIAFLNATQAVSVAADGVALRWDVTSPEARPTTLAKFTVGAVFRAALSPDRKWLAVAAEQRDRNVEVRSLEGGKGLTIELPREDLPHSLAFDPKGTRLAVGIRTVPEKADFFKETDDRVAVYDLTRDPPQASPGPKPTFHAEALAFHPGGHHLAVAGGNDHEVTLWDLRRLSRGPVATIRGPGSGLWSVGLSKDGRYLGYRDQREPDPSSPNRRGRGPWTRVFDLHTRTWAPPRNFQPVPPEDTCNGWRVEPSNDAYVWYVSGPDGERYRLPLDRARDGIPRCYTFLKPSGGRGVRLAVGHYWGVSIFDLSKGAPKFPARMLIGHQGYVTALATTAKQDILVSVSRDQTTAAWSLADWPSQAELGARFDERLGELRVEEVDPGSPAWEAGLAAGDDIVLFAYGGSEVKGGPAKWLEHLSQPVPGRECYFRVKRPGRAKPFDLLTTVRQRPLWRFFPTRNGEWVLWRWRDYYYAASSNGDSLIGWQISRDVDTRPEFYKAAEFRNVFYSPDKVAEAIKSMHFTPDRASLPDLQPPALRIETSTPEVKEEDLTVTLTVTPRGPRAFHQPERLLLWVGDHLFWRTPDGWQPKKGAFEVKVSIPRERLRTGFNRLTFQCYNGAGTRSGEETTVTKAGPPGKGRLFLVLVGAVDYSKVKPMHEGGAAPYDNLPGVGVDMERLEDVWEGQKGKLYQDVKVMRLDEEKVTPAALHDKLQAVARAAKPDDLLVLGLNGHGYSHGTEGNDPKKQKRGTFTFVCPAFDFQRPKATGITSERLYEDLTAVPCRKLVLLNACYSGDVDLRRDLRSNPLWSLAPDRVGPIILSASDFNEEAFSRRDGGLFTQAVAEALKEQFADADRDPKDGLVDTLELARFVRARVPLILAELKRDFKDSFAPKDLGKLQHPVFFPNEGSMERFPVAQK